MRPRKPGFAIPIFRDADGFWVQQTRHGKIIGFLRCDIEENQIISSANQKQKINFRDAGSTSQKLLPVQKIGRKKLFGFARPDGVVEIGSRADLKSVLLRLADQLENQPFVLQEVANFTEDKHLLKKANELTAAILPRKPEATKIKTVEVSNKRARQSVGVNLGKTSASIDFYTGGIRHISGLYLGRSFVETKGVSIGDKITVRIKFIQGSSFIRGRPVRTSASSFRERMGQKTTVFIGVVVNAGTRGEKAKKYGRVRFSNPEEENVVRSASKVITPRGGNPRCFEVIASNPRKIFNGKETQVVVRSTRDSYNYA